ncbi:MAG: Flp family type IVb pilin [Oxalobacteraceae bacterium]|jgi:pilus assembly protein Flp/PilA|nr:Flp family type IVb pilin [Oxalobacteraceae bacterium]
MNTLKQKLQSFLADEQGATAVEYGLMIALIAAVILTTVGLLGTELNTKFTSVKDAVKNAGSTGTGG